MNGWDLLPRVVGLLAAAAVMGIVVRKLGQNVIVGYLLAGLLVGPTGIGLVRSTEDVAVLSELGVALLLFAVGLEFSMAKLRQLGRVATIGGTLQIVATAVAVYGVSRWFGVAGGAATALGLAFAMSSTAVVLRELTDRAQLESPQGRAAVGVLLLQDMAVIPILVIVDSLAHDLGTGAMLAEIGTRSLLVCGFVVGAWAVAKHVAPHVLFGAASTGSRELPVILAVCCSVGAAWAAHTLGFSPSLGSFAAGIVLAESPFATQIRADVTPLSAVFITLFFASAGAAVRLPLEAGFLLPTAGLAMAVMAGKALIAGLAVFVAQGALRYAAMAGLILSQVGEFTFVVCAAAFRTGVLPEPLFQMAMGVSLLTLLLTPVLVGAAPGMVARVLRRLPVETRTAVAGQAQAKPRRRVLVIGCGPAGMAVVEALQAKKVPFLVLETNPDTVEKMSMRFPIELGDASQAEVLEHAGIRSGIAVVVTVPDPTACQLIVSVAQQLAPRVPILARLRYHQYLTELRHAGADRIVDEEETVGLHLAGEAIELAESQG